MKAKLLCGQKEYQVRLGWIHLMKNFEGMNYQLLCNCICTGQGTPYCNLFVKFKLRSCFSE